MIDLKAIAVGIAAAGVLALGPLGAGVANAAPTDPSAPSVQGTSSQTDAVTPSPYAASMDALTKSRRALSSFGRPMPYFSG
jgi:hypothetical protein